MKLSEIYEMNFAAGAVTQDGNPGVTALQSCCEYYDRVLCDAIARGEKWVYTNSNEYAPQQTSFQEMVDSGKHGANCAMLSNWAFMDIGIMPFGARFWGGRDCTFVHYEDLRPLIDAACEVTHYPEGIRFAELFETGEVKAGDVFLAKGHTYVYRGDRSFYASGFDTPWHPDESVPTEDHRHGIFERWIVPMEQSSNIRSTAYFRIRIRDDFVPLRCRNRAGELEEITR